MMTDILLSFGDFEFPSNPHTIKAQYGADIEQTGLLSTQSISERTALRPAVISGEGRFWGDEAQEYCTRLAFMMKSERSYYLLCPGVYPLKAYLSDFSYSLDSGGCAASYSFKFVEDTSGNAGDIKIMFTTALEGENAFELANRCNVGVDDVMRLNDIKSPFELEAGRRIRIYENSND